MRARLLGSVLAVATAAVLAAGCSGPSTEHGTADVTFAKAMVPHHAQAVTMADEAPARAASPEVKDLASRIRAAQGPEIDRMQQMLASWGAPAASTEDDHMAMPGMGMMDDGQMQQLAAASGPGFDRQFLQLMIQHHTGAIEMARTELAQGQNPDAKQLAGSIVADQQREIGTMQQLLSRI